MIRNVIFDWSGTLVNDLPAVWKATNQVLVQARGKKLTLEQFRAEFCLPFKPFYDKHAPLIPLRQLEAWYHRRFDRLQNLIGELPHAREFLEFCRASRLRTFLLSSVQREHFAAQQTATGFGKYLDRVYVQVRDKRKKIHDILVGNKLKPDETLFVGDMQHDIETARHGGIHACAVLTGYNTLQQLRAAQPDVIVEHLGELRDILEQNQFQLPRRNSRGKAAVRRSGAGSRKRPAHPGSQWLDYRAGLTPTATVGALIINGAGEVLMVRTHKWSDLWGIPGGKIKGGERSVAALRREIREETGLAVRDIEFVLVQDCIHSKEFYRDAHFILLNYVCRCAGRPRVRLNEEAREYRWVTAGRALRMALNRPTQVLLRAVVAAKNTRSITGKRKHVENQHR